MVLSDTQSMKIRSKHITNKYFRLESKLYISYSFHHLYLCWYKVIILRYFLPQLADERFCFLSTLHTHRYVFTIQSFDSLWAIDNFFLNVFCFSLSCTNCIRLKFLDYSWFLSQVTKQIFNIFPDILHKNNEKNISINKDNTEI